MSIGSHHQKIDCVISDISLEDLSSRGSPLGNNFKLGFDAVRSQMLNEGFSGFPLRRCFVIGRREDPDCFDALQQPHCIRDCSGGLLTVIPGNRRMIERTG
jgi:hypothetical protein